jgi:hypothetical protein
MVIKLWFLGIRHWISWQIVPMAWRSLLSLSWRWRKQVSLKHWATYPTTQHYFLETCNLQCRPVFSFTVWPLQHQGRSLSTYWRWGWIGLRSVKTWRNKSYLRQKNSSYYMFSYKQSQKCRKSNSSFRSKNMIWNILNCERWHISILHIKLQLLPHGVRLHYKDKLVNTVWWNNWSLL